MLGSLKYLTKIFITTVPIELRAESAASRSAEYIATLHDYEISLRHSSSGRINRNDPYFFLSQVYYFENPII